MPLILAIEPDRRQASNLAAVLRRRPRTELVIAESASRALDALAARVPDVLLTSPLLSPQDETTLADWLRSLGPAAARVHSLTIPILATAKPAEPPRGVMSVLRRRRANVSTPDGCEPDAFADQVDVYLERTSTERENETAPNPEPVMAIAAVPEPIAPELTVPEPVVPEPAVLEAVMPEAVMPEEVLAQEVLAEEVLPEEAVPQEVVLEPALPEPVLLEAMLEATPEPVFEMASEVIAADAADVAPLVVEPEEIPAPALTTALVADASPGLGARLREALAAFRRQLPSLTIPDMAVASPATQDPVVIEAPVLAVVPDDPPAEVTLAAIADDDATWISVPLEELEEAPVFAVEAQDEPLAAEDVWILSPVQGVEEFFTPARPALPAASPVIIAAAAPVVPPAPVVALPEPVVEVAVAQPVEDVAPPPAPRKKTAKAKRPKPVQDEWGFFDPDQCGFAALLDKLDEITEDESAVEKREDTTVRVVAY